MSSENESGSMDTTGSPTNPSHPVAPHTIPGPPANSRKRDTGLFLAGSEPFNSSSYAEPTGMIPPPPPAGLQDAPTIPPPPPPPLYQQPHLYTTPLAQALGKQRVTALWLLIAIPWVLVAILLLSLIALSLRPRSTSTVSDHTATSTSTPISVATATPNTQVQTTGSYTSTTNEITVQPTHFNAGTDCQVDNGYRCTATIFVSNGYHGNLSWQATGDGALTKFSPDDGIFAPGQQQQVIIYIHNTCPASGLFTFSTSDNQVSVPWNC